MPPTPDQNIHVPIPNVLTTVGNNSTVYKSMVTNAAEIPNLPNNAKIDAEWVLSFFKDPAIIQATPVNE